MFTVIYRWKIDPVKERQFEAAWAQLTHLIRAHRGGLGSRLHRCSDGSYLAYAQWSDRSTWENASRIPLPSTDAMERMNDAIVSSEEPIEMTVLADLLRPAK